MTHVAYYKNLTFWEIAQNIPVGTFRQSLKFRRWINVEISTSNFQRFFDVFSTPNKNPLKYRRRYSNDRRNVNDFSTTVEIFLRFSTLYFRSTSIQPWIDVENARWEASKFLVFNWFQTTFLYVTAFFFEHSKLHGLSNSLTSSE